MLVQERTLIKVSEFRKAFDGMLAVDRINFSVQPGEILGLIGPNGAGKTTTLRSLSGLTIPTEGELSVCGFNVEKQPLEVKKRLAYIPDDPPLFPELTVTQHLAFTASVFSVQDYRFFCVADYGCGKYSRTFSPPPHSPKSQC